MKANWKTKNSLNQTIDLTFRKIQIEGGNKGGYVHTYAFSSYFLDHYGASATVLKNLCDCLQRADLCWRSRLQSSSP